MAEQLVKLFSKDIQKNLFPDNAFYKNSRLDGGINVNAKTVQIPQSGNSAGVVENPTSFPLTVTQRVDDVKEYDVDLLALEPIHIEDVNEMVINYSKRQDVLEDNNLVLRTRIADKLAYLWTPTETSHILKTSGETRPSSFGGTAKKKVTYDDIVNLAKAMDKDDIPSEGRFLLVGAEMYSDLLSIKEFISIDYTKNKAVPKGVVGEIMGFMIYKRSRATIFSDAFAKKSPTQAGAETDRESILAWHKSFVRRGEGNIKVYADLDKPTYLGSIFNAAVRVGGTSGRNDEKGVYSLVQENFA